MRALLSISRLTLQGATLFLQDFKAFFKLCDFPRTLNKEITCKSRTEQSYGTVSDVRPSPNVSLPAAELLLFQGVSRFRGVRLGFGTQAKIFGVGLGIHVSYMAVGGTRCNG